MNTQNEKPMSAYDRKFKTLLGFTKPAQYGGREPVYLSGFEWSCGWYWGGGYIGNKNFHSHFDDAFLKAPDPRGHCLGNFVTPWGPRQTNNPGTALRNGTAVWEDLSVFLDDVPDHIAKNWWRIKDLYSQFYALRKAAEVFQYGGHCSSQGRTKEELQPKLAREINLHIAGVIIPEVCRAVGADNET